MPTNASTYAGTADAMTRAALQAAVALPADLTQFNATNSAANANMEMSASSTTDMNKANLLAATIYTNTNLVATVNDGMNANTYITSLINTEKTRIDGANSTVRNEQFKLRTKLLGYEYLLNYYRTGTWMVIFTLYVSLSTLVVAAMWRAGALSLYPFLIIVGLALACYGVIVIAATAYVASRSKTSWAHRDWKVRNQTSITSATFTA